MVKNKIKNLIKSSIKNLQKEKVFPKFDIPEVKIEKPKEEIHGDYSTNIALKIAEIIKKESMEIAKLLISKLKIIGSQLFERIEAAKPGFINFFLSKRYLQKEIKKILDKKEDYGKLKIGKNKKVQVEFISANPTGPLHIGNGRGAFFGNVLASILEKAGYTVEREYYINDGKFNAQIRALGQTALGKGIAYLTPYLESKILKLKSKLQKIKDEGKAGYLLAQEIQKDIKNFIEKDLKIKFDNWVSEEDLYQKSQVNKILQWLERRNLVYEKGGAKWIRISDFGAPKDEVLVRKTGDPTYFLTDIAYHKHKFERGYQKIINIWGADHQGHIPKIKAAAKILGYKGNLEILISQIVSLKGRKKLSKRKGEIITLEWLINEVGLDAAKFFYLMESLDTSMEFDVELAKEKSKKSLVYYVQYAHARICSILKKAKIQSKKLKAKNLELLNHPSELALIKQLIRFPEIVEETAKDYQVQRIPRYAVALATCFHQFYRDCRVISQDKNLTQARLALILATKVVLKNALDLMGISTPQRM